MSAIRCAGWSGEAGLAADVAAASSHAIEARNKQAVVTQLPIHTPYDGSSKLFQIGLKQLDLDELDRDRRDFDFQLAEKRRIYARTSRQVCSSPKPGTEDAQAEVLALLSRASAGAVSRALSAGR